MNCVYVCRAHAIVCLDDECLESKRRCESVLYELLINRKKLMIFNRDMFVFVAK